jgi:hypothetical protein
MGNVCPCVAKSNSKKGNSGKDVGKGVELEIPPKNEVALMERPSLL